MGVCKQSVWNWENGFAEPEDRLYPALIGFLGYEPWPSPQTFGERLRAERLRRGLSIKGAAQLLAVAHGAFANWEYGKTMPSRINRVRADAFLHGD